MGPTCAKSLTTTARVSHAALTIASAESEVGSTAETSAAISGAASCCETCQPRANRQWDRCKTAAKSMCAALTARRSARHAGTPGLEVAYLAVGIGVEERSAQLDSCDVAACRRSRNAQRVLSTCAIDCGLQRRELARANYRTRTALTGKGAAGTSEDDRHQSHKLRKVEAVFCLQPFEMLEHACHEQGAL